MILQGKKALRLVELMGLMALPSLVACGSVSMPIGDVYTSSHCHITAEGVTQIPNQQALGDVIRKSTSAMVGTIGPVIPEVEFETSMAYVISMGSKPTTGYAIQLMAKEAGYKNGVVDLPVKLIEPGQAMVAQLMTSPCKIITLPKGDYQRVDM